MAQICLEHVKGNTYYIPSPTNIGVYVKNGEAALIDSGNDKEAGRQILRLINQNGWELKMIVNTHSNADHIGGNQFLQERTSCKIAAAQEEAAFITNPLLEPAFLYGGFPNKDMRNKFLMAKPSNVTTIIDESGEIAGSGLRAVSLPGHYFAMVGIMTPDNVFFTADSLFPENIITKYHLFYLLDIRAHLETIEKLKTIDADVYIPSHGEPISRVDSLCQINKEKIQEILSRVREACEKPASTEEVMEKVCAVYGISLNMTQYVLVSSTIRSYLTYLYEEGSIDCEFKGHQMEWLKK